MVKRCGQNVITRRYLVGLLIGGKTNLDFKYDIKFLTCEFVISNNFIFKLPALIIFLLLENSD